MSEFSAAEVHRNKKRGVLWGFILSIVVLLILIGLQTLGGCAARVKTVTNLPSNVTQSQVQNWDTAVENLTAIAKTTSTLRQSVVSVRNAGAFPDDKAYVTTLQSLAKIDQAQLAASAVLRQAPQTWDKSTAQQITIYVNIISNELTAINSAGETGIKNPDSLATINGAISDVSNAVKIILALSF